jgi:lysozyme
MKVVSKAGIDLIKEFEGFKEDWYRCPSGKRTIGYGHVYTGKEKIKAPITEKEAEAILISDLKPINEYLYRTIPKLQQHQHDAIAAFIYNVGIGQFSTSTLKKCIDANECDEVVSREFMRWTRSKKSPLAESVVVPGLVRRRTAELRMFVSGGGQ